MPAYSVLAHIIGKKCWSIYREINESRYFYNEKYNVLHGDWFLYTHTHYHKSSSLLYSVGAEMFYLRDLNNFLNGLLEHFDTRFT